MKDADTNIDQAEIAKFEAMSSIWWDKNGELKALHDINGLRLNFINDRAPLAGKQVLDVACGGGILSEAMAALGAEVTGIDAGKPPKIFRKLTGSISMWSPVWNYLNMFLSLHP
jgi:2-polyprenyl-6-hydroxyphenyl methylase/3-demethylubiquinone-9 3-methyltransferase